jgi:all-trans-8'-apo-beta-carotenal 15,15'-oxygenase
VIYQGWTWRAEVDLERGPLATNPTINIYEWDNAMKSAPPTMHKFSFTSVAPHDFSITENYYVFVENRIGGDTLPYILGTKCPAECVDIESSSPMVLNVVKRPSLNDSMQGKNTIDADTIRLNLRPGFSIHSVCSFEKSKFVNETFVNTLELYTSAWKCETIESGKVKGGLLGSWEGAAPRFDEIPETLLYKTEVDLDSKVILSHAPVIDMENIIVEHPHINPKFEGRPVRYIYMSIGSLNGISSPPLGYLRLDLNTNDKQIWFAPLHTYCEELVVVPKSQSLDLADEENVWLLGTMFDAEKEKTCLAVFDGNHVENGPICQIWLSHGLPHSLHGCFVSSN